MATKGNNGLTGTYMYRLLTTGKGRYQLTTERLLSQFNRSAKSSETDGTFRAVCLSGIRSDNNTGTGPDDNDASIEGRVIEIIVRPLIPIGDIVPDPRLSTTPEAINDDITTIGAMYTARSDFGFKGQNPIPFGHEVNCYFEKGSIANSDLTGLRFQDPGEDTIPEPSYVKLATIEGVITGATAFENGLAGLLGNDFTDSKFPPRQAIYMGFNGQYSGEVVLNGKLPAQILSKATKGGPNKPMLLIDAVSGWNRMATAFAAKFTGMQLGAWGYRPYTRQLSIRKEKPKLSAKPGTSNHGWGLAIDTHYFNAGGARLPLAYSGAQYIWLSQNAAGFGWENPAWARKGGSKQEPWHWEWKNKDQIMQRK